MTQVTLRRLIGAAQELVAINQAVASGQCTRESAVAIIINLFGYSEEEVDAMVAEKCKKPNRHLKLRMIQTIPKKIRNSKNNLKTLSYEK